MNKKDNSFVSHLKVKYTNVDVDKVLELFDKEASRVKPVGDKNHPNLEAKFPIDCDLIKDILISVISKL